MHREITTGTYWFYRKNFDKGSMNMDITLTCDVDGDVLQAAALRTIRRLPCLAFTCEKSENGTQYYLIPNMKPFSVVPASGFVSLDGPGAGGYLWSLGYGENHLYLRVFHGLTDGMGLFTVMKHILIFYFSLLNGDPVPPELALSLLLSEKNREFVRILTEEIYSLGIKYRLE